MSRYLAVLVISVVLPFILSFWPPLRFYRNLRALIVSISVTALLFGGWDVFAVWRGHWDFDPSALCGLKVANLPLEEALFFVVIPFCCIFTWEAILYIRGRR